MRTRSVIALNAVAIVLLAATSTAVIAVARASFHRDYRRSNHRTTCVVPNLPGHYASRMYAQLTVR